MPQNNNFLEEVKFFLQCHWFSKSFLSNYLNFYLNFYYYARILGKRKPYPFKFRNPTRWILRRKKLLTIKPEYVKSLYKTNFKRFGFSSLSGLMSTSRRRWSYKNRIFYGYPMRHFTFFFFRCAKKKKVSIFKFSHLKFSYKVPVVTTFALQQRLFLYERRVRNQMWNFLYKKVKRILVERKNRTNKFLQTFLPSKLVKKTILFNANKPLIWKMRNARYTHWNFRTIGKLNQWRYDKLLAWELNKLVFGVSKQMLAHILLRTYSCLISWRQILTLIKYQLISINGCYYNDNIKIKQGDIIELPFRVKRDFGNSKKKRRRAYTGLIFRARRVAYNAYAQRNRRLVKKYKFLPKIFKRIPVGFKKLGSLLARDKSLNVYGVILPLQAVSFDVDYEMTHTSVLTLQNWRYRFD